MENTCLGIKMPRILLPADCIDMRKWAVVACDQYTSQPEYWERTDEYVKDSPSTLRLILPEAYLGKVDEGCYADAIHDTMDKYTRDGTLTELPEGAILVTRHVDGKTRTGLLVAFDLDCYDYKKGSKTLIRATEETVESRVAARLALREGACLELPHIMMLIDDPQHTVIEPLIRAPKRRVYDFELMERGGRITGDFIQEADMAGVLDALFELSKKWTDREKEGLMLYAMGDGNHSFAAAKAAWERRKPLLSNEERENDPARFALAELVNVHDAGLVFEPIHRLVKHADASFIERLAKVIELQNASAKVETAADFTGKKGHVLPFVTECESGALVVDKPVCKLPAATLQNALEAMGAEVDYIHGDDALTTLGQMPNCVGFLLPAMEKEALFTTVLLEGALPKKTFSMGEANEKRFYLEARSLRN